MSRHTGFRPASAALPLEGEIMAVRRRPVRLVLERIAVGGVAGLATTFALTPAVFAATDEVKPDRSEPGRSPAPSTPSGHPDRDKQEATADALAGDFGDQKYRIGVQIADGSWVPAGTNTASSTFTITETGPNVVDSDGDSVPSFTFTCTSTETPDEGMNASTTICLDPRDVPAQRASSSSTAGDVAAAAVQGGVTIDPTEDDAPSDQILYAARGSTVTIKQVTAGANLVTTPAVATLEPCEGVVDIFDDGVLVFCSGNYNSNTRLSTVTFANPGLPPVATNDARTTQPNTPIDIAVLTNDDTVNGAPLAGLTVARAPGNGTAAVLGAVGTASVHTAATGPVITYTPKAGFSGQDTFDYTLSTPNGSATATVTVTVPAAPAAPDAPADETDDPETDEPVTDTRDEEAALPNVGGVDKGLLGLGTALIAGGGFLTAASRRGRDQHGLGA